MTLSFDVFFSALSEVQDTIYVYSDCHYILHREFTQTNYKCLETFMRPIVFGFEKSVGR